MTAGWTKRSGMGLLWAVLVACGSPSPGPGPLDGGSDAGSSCPTGAGEASTGPCLVARYAGTYAVSAVSGAHSRGSVIIGSDGSVDYDTGKQFAIGDFQGVYDRLDCCKRVTVEMNPRADNDASPAGARHRVDLFTVDATVGSAVERIEYYPNWPSTTGKVELTASP